MGTLWPGSQGEPLRTVTDESTQVAGFAGASQNTAADYVATREELCDQLIASLASSTAPRTYIGLLPADVRRIVRDLEVAVRLSDVLRIEPARAVI